MIDEFAVLDDKKRHFINTVLFKRKRILNNPGYKIQITYLDKNQVEIDKYEYACLARVLRDLSHVKFRFLRIKVDPYSFTNAKKWIQICLKYNLLGPINQSADDILENGVFYDILNPKWGMDKLYTSFSLYRFIKEEPYVIQNILDMLENNFNFFQAFLYSHKRFIKNSNHSFLNISEYKAGGNWENQELNIEMIIGLITYFSESKPILKTIDNYSNWRINKYFIPNKTKFVGSLDEILFDKTSEVVEKAFKEAYRIL